jgi:hypothetical protein
LAEDLLPPDYNREKEEERRQRRQEDPYRNRDWDQDQIWRNEMVLMLIGSTWDAVMDRCLQTLEQTRRPFRVQIVTAQWGPGRKEQRPLDRFANRQTEKRYSSRWKLFLYHLFRAAPLPVEVPQA